MVRSFRECGKDSKKAPGGHQRPLQNTRKAKSEALPKLRLRILY